MFAIGTGEDDMRGQVSRFVKPGAIGIILGLAALSASPAAGRPVGKEAQSVIDTILAPPAIKTADGFKATVLVPPGELYDPLSMVPQDGSIWMNDDGKATDGHGSRILAFAPDGTFSVLFDADEILPVVGFDVAPPGFGAYSGQIFALSQPTTGMKGGLANHVIQRIDPATREISIFCTLPEAGDEGNGIAGFGAQTSFGLAGSAFANKLYAITILNKMIYQIEADGTCKPFADVSSLGGGSFAFTPDGSAMLVSGTSEDASAPEDAPKGIVARITPNGKIDPKPVVKGLMAPSGIAIAPATFGAYGGEIFVLDAGEFELPVPQTQASEQDGKLYRVASNGELKLVASGFANPTGLLFTDGHLWVSDINGDFIGGGRELPDGFLVQIDPH